MRIVHVCRVGAPSVGGMESFVHGLARVQRAAGHEPRVVTLTAEGDARVEGIPYRRVARVGPRSYPGAVRLWDAVGAADIVHVHGVDGLADQLLWGRRRRPPVGVSTHGGYFHSNRVRWAKQVLLRTWTRGTLGRADAVWFTSAADAARFEAAGIQGDVVPNGVDLGWCGQVVRRPEPGRWLVWGRVDRHKGIDDLIDTLLWLARWGRAPRRVDIVGPSRDPVLAAALRARAAAAGVARRLRWRGEVSRDVLLHYLSRAEWAVFPSRQEGFGIAVVESLAAGVPVLVRPIPAHRELVQDGLQGHWIPFEASQDAAARLANLTARRPDPGVSRRARDRAVRYGWDAVSVRWASAYARLIAGA